MIRPVLGKNPAMNVQGRHYRTIWECDQREAVVQIIDQRHLPHQLVIEDLATVDQVAVAIADMHVRGAGLIGATAGYGMAIAASCSGGEGAAIQQAMASFHCHF